MNSVLLTLIVVINDYLVLKAENFGTFRLNT